MPLYEDTLATHNNLIELGKQLNEKEKIKENKEKYLNEVLSDLSQFDTFNFDKIVLSDSYKSILNTMSTDINGFAVANKNNLIKYMFANYLLKCKIEIMTKEVELLKDTEENLNDQYENTIEELEEKEEELELVNLEFYNFKFYSVIFFLIYNYIIFFNYQEIYNHFSIVGSFVFNLVYIFVFEGYIFNLFGILFFLLGFKYASDLLIHYLNNTKKKD